MNGFLHDQFTKNMPLEIIMQDQEKAEKIKKLIQEFFEIIGNCKIHVPVDQKVEYLSKLKSKCEQWGLDYANVFGIDQITPYIHVFSAHLYEFFDCFDNLNTFSLQGVERLNELLTRDYFVGSNKKGDYFKDMLRKRICQMLMPLTRTQIAHLREAMSLYDRYDADYEVSDEDEILNINDLEPLSDEEGYVVY
ncbi:unnamed protein product [Didymodactylos carnosus]|uniref:Uncharacterized protein n=1 Tax=Didymodactylos carnosus TaxID=1234261 RepID=A0A8S2EPQ3_9BILA|nr:unnamed protein product [Didymodactylos carnosus]CAF4014749.1 unnamed protein product [Didymodactylos carnosus]CAF4562338.1 unnamed protein product [Didymodactylos carnosus]